MFSWELERYPNLSFVGFNCSVLFSLVTSHSPTNSWTSVALLFTFSSKLVDVNP
ncbi:hypothetical protein NW739_01020 [Mycoplasmopsis felis]|uniref:hypothetical protein n=1 Tax=Mycoplasmopsis felis TaxID=33923 RepID=UPI0021DF7985|nr:hypothetical protein [Mycoplasmopsis felis]MCU9939407.1 hypothetical protein [Mycoplasmopsis felis]